MSHELSLIAFTCFSCLAAGIFLAVTLAEVRQHSEQTLFYGALLSLISLAAAGVCAVWNLGRPEMILGALGNPGSGIFLEMISSILFGLTLLVYLFLIYRGASEGTIKAASYAGSFFGLLLAFALGKNLIMEWRAAWNTYALALPFIGWALACAGFSFAVLRHFNDEDNAPAGLIAVCGVLAALVCSGAYFAALSVSSVEEANEAFLSCVGGEHSLEFWAGILGAGILAPLALAFATKAKSLWINFICLILTLVGTAFFQLVVFQLGTATWQFFKR